MDGTATEEADDGSEHACEHPTDCDVLLRSLAFEFLHLAFTMCDQVESEFKLRKSKKPQRLATTSWDLLD